MTTSTPTRIDRLFDKLKALYGSQFLAKWADVDPVELHRIWTAALERYTGEEIAGALGGVLESCQFPPSLPEFVALCSKAKQARAPIQPAFHLPAPDTSADGKAAREKAAALLRSVGNPQPGRDWARKARARHQSREHLLTPEELAIVDDALRFEPVELNRAAA
jgi:hypothetical protein